MTTDKSNPNALINALSPYLLQHAYNPVQWHEWSSDLLTRAQAENKPLIISIGYSACHWCHVMEHECFEDDEVAAVMNQHFICIKIDREERSDLDNIYMEACHAMGLQGGWPLNVFATPEGKPFYGGTYFPKPNWLKLLTGVANAWTSNEADLRKSGEDFARALSSSDLERFGLSPQEREFTQQAAHELIKNLIPHFDQQLGGLGSAPKFPVPAVWQLCRHYLHVNEDEIVVDGLWHTLMQMSMGGLYDHLGGGFARYSVDAQWHIPHFEKMLYDNAQLMHLYADINTLYGDSWFADVVVNTGTFILRELTSPEGGFYSALDADSEGVEGKFYVWTMAELQELLGEEDAKLISAYYGVTANGNFEHGNSVLHKQMPLEEFAEKIGMDETELEARLEELHEIMFEARSQRVRPSLDDKILVSWNGLTISGFCAAYRMEHDDDFLKAAERNAQYLWSTARHEGQLYHVLKGDKRATPALLEDYAFLAQGLLDLHQVTQKRQYLEQASELIEVALGQFLDVEEQLFYVARPGQPDLIANRKELFDSVIPSGNAAMAWNLFRAGSLLQRTEWQALARHMLQLMGNLYLKNPRYAGHWAALHIAHAWPYPEVAMTGPGAATAAHQFIHTPFALRALLCADEQPSDLPLLEGRHNPDQLTIYVCEGNRCLRPVHSLAEALAQLDELLGTTFFAEEE